LQYLILKRSRIENEANNELEQDKEETKDLAVGESWEFITNQWQLEEPQMIIAYR